jgi:hypothetical protein
MGMPSRDGGTAGVRPGTPTLRLEAAATGLAERLGKMPPVQLACVLVIASQTLGVAARRWGEAVRSSPKDARREDLVACLSAMAEAREATRQAGDWLGAQEPVVRQLFATDLAMVTVGHPLAPAAAEEVARAWKVAWSSRRHVPAAVAELRAWEAGSGVPAFPPGADGLPPSDEAVVSSSMGFPSFLRQPIRRDGR